MMESQRADLASWLQDLDKGRVFQQHPVVKHTWGVLMTVVDYPGVSIGLRNAVEDRVAAGVSMQVRNILFNSIWDCLDWQELDDAP